MRLLQFALLPLVLAGCPDRGLSSLSPVQGTVETKDIPANPRRDVDILFLIDNSGSMKEEQGSLRANFSRFMDVLQTLDGGMPNVHIGVATSDLGQSATDGSVGTAPFQSCSGKGDDGVMRTAPMITGRFISDTDNHAGGRNVNYSGTLGDTFAAIANVGVTGCGLEQHLGGIERALSNSANAGFLRTDAYLAVVVIGDEDDCSLAHSGIFGTSTDGVAVNFRCTKDGVVCDDTPNDLTTPGVRTKCRPNHTAQYVNDVDRYVSFLKGLKPDPLDVIVAGIVGDPHPFQIETMGSQPVLAPSCRYTSSGGTAQTAFPAARTSEFLSRFETRNTRSTICTGDLSMGLTQIAALLKAVISDPCFESQLLDIDPDTAGPQYDCTVTDVRHVPGGADQELAVVPACDASHTQKPCWTIQEDAAKCGYTHTDLHLKLVVDRNAIVPPADVHVKVSCVTKPSDGPVI